MTSMMSLSAAAAFFAGLHLLVSGTSLRGVLVARLGEQAFRGLFSLGSLAGIIWLVMSYNRAYPHTEVLWTAPAAITHLGIPLLLIAFLLAVIGLLTPNPTAAMQEGLLQKDAGAVTGMLRITRHPFLWGVTLWSAFHLAANGDTASVIFFGCFLAVAFFGTFSIDAKRAKAFGEHWKSFAAGSSNIPFAAVLTGRQSLRLGEIGLMRILAALVIFAALLLSHAWLFNVSPFPGGWIPF